MTTQFFYKTCETHLCAFNARHIVTARRNKIYPETVQALSTVTEGYENNLLAGLSNISQIQ